MDRVSFYYPRCILKVKPRGKEIDVMMTVLNSGRRDLITSPEEWTGGTEVREYRSKMRGGSPKGFTFRLV